MKVWIRFLENKWKCSYEILLFNFLCNILIKHFRPTVQCMAHERCRLSRFPLVKHFPTKTRTVRGMDPNYTHPLFAPNYTHSHAIEWLIEWLMYVACNFFPFFLKNHFTCGIQFSFLLRISTTYMGRPNQAEFGWIVSEKLRFQKCVYIL